MYLFSWGSIKLPRVLVKGPRNIAVLVGVFKNVNVFSVGPQNILVLETGAKI